MIIKINFRDKEYLFNFSGLNPLYELIDRDYLLSKIKISQIETTCEEKLKDAFSPEMIYEAIDRKATFGLYDKKDPYGGWFALSSKTLEETKKDFKEILEDEVYEYVDFTIFDFENMSIIDLKKNISLSNKDVYTVETENHIFVGNKEEAEKYIHKIMMENKFSVLDIFSFFKIYKNGEEINIKEYAPILQ